MDEIAGAQLQCNRQVMVFGQPGNTGNIDQLGIAGVGRGDALSIASIFKFGSVVVFRKARADIVQQAPANLFEHMLMRMLEGMWLSR